MLATEALAIGERPVRSLLEMRQDRVVVQAWDLSCGAAALATLLNYQLDDPVTEKEIARGLIKREEYLEDPDLVRFRQGFSLLDLKRFVDGRGYQGIGLGKMVIDDLRSTAPVMVPVSFNGYNHFVIFRGIAETVSGRPRVLLSDPAFGNRTMLLEDFESAWLEHPELGRVGFTVALRDGSVLPNRLAPRISDFVTFR
ncbi:MAG: C39 family peptidase [Alphaproteobacteria bacterium]|nr:C39 family peptidase [Alphaproteobacteria bacterium]